MTKKLSEYSEKEIFRNYENYWKKEAEKHGLFNIPFAPNQSRLRHDIFNVYSYGNDLVKVIYIKSAQKKADPKKDPLWREKKTLKIEKQKKPEGERFSNSISRSKARIFELAMCNEFRFFCTFTQDQNNRDRFNLKEFRKDFAQLVRNLNRTRPENRKIRYLLIPEQHKDGAWHMHGLLQGLEPSDLREFRLDERLPVRIKKQIESGVKVYDWTRYRKAFGYFTCTEIENTTACAKYITKYISKDLQKTLHESGEHLFFASQGLKGREVVLKECADPCFVNEWDFENDYVKVKEFYVSDKSDLKK